MSLIMSRRDLEFLLFEWLDTESLFERKRYAEHSRDVAEDLLGLAERIATDHFAPHNRAADLAEPRFDGERVELVPEVEPALRAFADAGFLAAPLSEEAGGLQLPSSVFGACMAWFHAANVGTAGYALLTLANANLLTVHATPELVARFVEPMTTGRFFGTMALSEPEAGSNLADITTRAEPQADGTYRVFGRKMWISGGDHEMGENIVHLVLARTPGAPLGTKGISLFLVPKFLVADDGSVGERNDVVLAGINHKMGFRGTVNTAPVFGEGAFTPGGQPGRRRLPRRHREPGPARHVHDDERGPDRRRPRRHGPRLHRLPEVAGLRARAAAGQAVGCIAGVPAGAARRAPGRAPDAARAEVVRRGRAGAQPLLLAAGRRHRVPRRRDARRPRRRSCSGSSPRSPRAGPRSGAWPRTTWPSRCSAAPATPATTTSSSTTATTGSTRSTRAPTASRGSTCSVARC